MKILASGLRAATAVRNSQGSVRPLSKVMTLGTNYRLIFPIQRTENGERDILVAAVPGRQLDFKKLGQSFLRLDDFDQDESGKIIDNSGVAPYSRISRVFHAAEYAAAEDAARNEAEKIRLRQGKDEIDAVALNKKITELKEQYFGDKQKNPVVYAKETPMIGGVSIATATECIVIPLDKNGAPDWANVTNAAFDIRNRKAVQLANILNNRDYCPEDAEFLEVGWSWIGSSPQEAGGAAAPQGISHDTSLAVKFPESWEANKEIISRLPKTAENIAARNMTMSSRATAKEVIELFKKYMLGHPLILTYINYEEDITKAAAKDILDFGIVSDMPKIQEELLKLIDEDGENDESESVDNATDILSAVQVDALKEAATMSQVMAAVPNLDEVAGPDDISSL